MATAAPPPAGAHHRERVGFLLARIGRHAWARFEEALAPLQLRPRHYVVLVELRDRETTTQQTLLDELGFDPSTLVALLNALEQQGLIARRRDPADRRRHIVELTRKGAKRLDEGERALRDAEERLVGALDEAERRALRAALMRIEDAAEADGADAC